jgi:hypothetical protein
MGNKQGSSFVKPDEHEQAVFDKAKSRNQVAVIMYIPKDNYKPHASIYAMQGKIIVQEDKKEGMIDIDHRTGEPCYRDRGMGFHYVSQNGYPL